MKTLLTIVIPVFNRANVVLRTLDSIAAQTRRPVKIVLVDNNSSDNTLAVLQQWQSRMQGTAMQVDVISETRPGACAARNAGLASADTEWTMFFDSDDVMLPGHLNRVLDAINSAEDADLIGWPIQFVSLDGRRDKVLIFSDRNLTFNNIFQSITGTTRYVARTSLLRRAGGWSEGLGIADDVELGQRMIALSPRVRRLAGAPTVESVESPGSIMTGSTGRMASYLRAAGRIKKSVEPRHAHWVDLQTILIARTWAKDDPEAPIAVQGILDSARGFRKILWWMLDCYTRHGGRGAARLYFPLRNI